MLTLGGKLKQKERLSARLGDVLSQLYICSAMLKRYEAEGRPAADQAILAWAFHDSVHKIQIAMRRVIDNFPNRGLRVLLRAVVFPLGRWERAPGDRLSHRVAQLLLSPSAARERLTRGIFATPGSGHPISLMEEALPKVINAEPLERKLMKAVKAGEVRGLTFEEQVRHATEQGVLSEAEAETLNEVRALVLEIIAVDDFDHDELRSSRRVRLTSLVSSLIDNLNPIPPGPNIGCICCRMLMVVDVESVKVEVQLGERLPRSGTAIAIRGARRIGSSRDCALRAGADGRTATGERAIRAAGTAA